MDASRGAILPSGQGGIQTCQGWVVADGRRRLVRVAQSDIAQPVQRSGQRRGPDPGRPLRLPGGPVDIEKAMGAGIGQRSPSLGESLVRGDDSLMRWDSAGPVTQPLAQHRPVDAVGVGHQRGEAVTPGGLMHPGVPQQRQPSPQRLRQPALAGQDEGGHPAVDAGLTSDR